MTYAVATPPDITFDIPFDITTRTAPGSFSTTRGRIHWDVSIDGIGFTLAPVDDFPYQRQTVISQKEQLDTSVEAGEQTLSGYWLRSQTSWHHGAGVNFYEPGLNDAEALPTRYRFLKSVGLDPWTVGDLKLLKKTTSAQTTASAVPRVAGLKAADGTNGFFSVDNGVLKRWIAASGATILDTFTRANSTTTLGSTESPVVAWTAAALTWGIDTNRAYQVNPSTTTVGYAYLESGVTNHSFEAKITSLATDRYPGVHVRFVDSNNMYQARVEGSTGVVKTYRFQGGVVTQLGSTFVFADGDKLKIEALEEAGGTRVNVYKNGTLQISPLDTDGSRPTTGTKFGITYAILNSATGSSFFDDVTAVYTAALASTSYTGATAVNVAVAGSKVLVGTSAGISSGDISGSTLTSLYTGATVTPGVYWLKNRIMATMGNKIIELALDGTSGSGNMSTPTPAMTHADANWTWTCMTEAPGAILAAGYAGGVGAIYAFTLSDSATSGGSPKLSQGYQVAEFPPGEEVHAIKVYLGAYIGIGTSRGVRVGLVDDTGKIQYGPLLVTTTNPVKALAARDSFIFAGVTAAIDGYSGLARINLGETIGGDSLIFPWTWDAQTHTTGPVTSICLFGTTDRAVIAVGTDAIWVQHATDYEASGYLVSGSIRFGTTEPKSFRAMDVRHRTTAGSVGVSTIDPNGAEQSLISLAAGVNGSNISLAALPEGLEYLSYKLTFNSAPAATPVVESVGVKALPNVTPQTRVQYPVMIDDKMRDSSNNAYGHRGYAAEVVQALEEKMFSKTVIQVADFTVGKDGESYPAIIEAFEFTRTTPPTPGPEGANFGGTGKITVRRIT